MCGSPRIADLQETNHERFRFTIPFAVRVADVNYGGHVSNAAVLSFFQDARIASYLENLGSYGKLDIGGCGMILPEAHSRYRAEMFLGDVLEIGARIDELRNSSFLMHYRIERRGEGTAEGIINLVVFDYTQRRPKRLPEGFRVAVSEFEGADVFAKARPEEEN